MARTNSDIQNVQVESPEPWSTILMTDIWKDIVIIIYTDSMLDSLRITLPKNPINWQKASIVTLNNIWLVTLDWWTINWAIDSLPINGYVTYIYSSITQQWFIIW